jgi:hypothetical protein
MKSSGILILMDLDSAVILMIYQMMVVHVVFQLIAILIKINYVGVLRPYRIKIPGGIAVVVVQTLAMWMEFVSLLPVHLVLQMGV